MTDTHAHDLPLLDWRPRGGLIEQADMERLKGQLRRVYTVMLDGAERSLEQLGKDALCPPASASARYRDLHAMGFPVDKKNEGGGLWLYFMKTNPSERR